MTNFMVCLYKSINSLLECDNLGQICCCLEATLVKPSPEQYSWRWWNSAISGPGKHILLTLQWTMTWWQVLNFRIPSFSSSTKLQQQLSEKRNSCQAFCLTTVVFAFCSIQCHTVIINDMPLLLMLNSISTGLVRPSIPSWSLIAKTLSYWLPG